ncbi:hypothetical protein CIB48_g9223 [Xylaria polymorpha]|nr:hypothetical protein CIB48_g9223 [Xylaria polymorpha]
MLFRPLRPLAAWATSLPTTPIRLNTSLGLHCARTLATTAALRTSEPLTIPTPAEPNEPPRLPYFVGRNNLNNLSVYHQKKRGGNLKLTILKKGEGDIQALRQDLRDALQLQNGDISVNSVTRHILIRGHMRDKVVHFLHTIGF